jgi:hypothetical protein
MYVYTVLLIHGKSDVLYIPSPSDMHQYGLSSRMAL